MNFNLAYKTMNLKVSCKAFLDSQARIQTRGIKLQHLLLKSNMIKEEIIIIMTY